MNEIAKLRLEAQAYALSMLGRNGNCIAVLSALKSDEEIKTRDKLHEQVKKSLFKIALDVISFHNMDNPDLEKVEEFVEELVDDVIINAESIIDKLNKPSEKDEKAPGEQ